MNIISSLLRFAALFAAYLLGLGGWVLCGQDKEASVLLTPEEWMKLAREDFDQAVEKLNSIDFKSPGGKVSKPDFQAARERGGAGENGHLPPLPTPDNAPARPILSPLVKKKFSYVLPMIAWRTDTDFDYNSASGPAKVELQSGVHFGVVAGRKFNNFRGELHFGYGFGEHAGFNHSNSGVGRLQADGDMQMLSAGARLLYDFSLSSDLSLQLGCGLGWSHREDKLEIIFSNEKAPLPSASSIAMTQEAVIALSWAFSNDWEGRLSYRWLGVDENGAYDKLRLQLLEAGLAKTF